MEPEFVYSKEVSLAHRRKYAQFFTPEKIVDLMNGWILGNSSLTTVLEPAFGLGIFSRNLLIKKKVHITGYEIDSVIYNKAQILFDNNENVSVSLNDYIESNWNEKFDGILCNPPYLKFHNYNNQFLVPRVNKKLGLNLNKSTNIYVLFLLKSISQLKEGGRCAYIIPSEFLNSDYGVQVKEYLIKSKFVRYIMVFSFKENVFEDALTTSSIILCANDKNDEKISFFNIETVEDLLSVKDILNDYPILPKCGLNYKLSELDAKIKWKNYYQPSEVGDYQNLVSFSNFAQVKRGIATGANAYFSFSLSKIRKYNIPMINLKPCICHINDISGFCFDNEQFNILANRNKNVYILNIKDAKEEHTELYIKKGESENFDKRFLTSKRNPWYSVEKRDVAPIWVGVFNRKGLRFIRNESEALNLTSCHCIYMKNSLFGVDADLFFAYLISNVAREIFQSNSREYGNGLSKFEPNDLNNAMVLNLGCLTKSEKERIIEIYRLNKKNSDTSFILEIDKILNRKFLKKE